MSQNQYDRQDLAQQYAGSDEQSSDRIRHPGLTRPMGDQPDHGEDSYRGSGRLEGRRAVITGGDSGIGRAVALAFAREGADNPERLSTLGAPWAAHCGSAKA